MHKFFNNKALRKVNGKQYARPFIVKRYNSPWPIRNLVDIDIWYNRMLFSLEYEHIVISDAPCKIKLTPKKQESYPITTKEFDDLVNLNKFYRRPL